MEYTYINKKVKSNRIYELKNPEIKASIFNANNVSLDCKFMKSQTLNKQVKELLTNKKIKWKNCKIGFKGKSKIDKDIRSCKFLEFNISKFNYLLTELNFKANQLRKKIFTSVKVDFNEKSNIKILKYWKNGFFKKHADTKICENHVGTFVLIAPKSIADHDGGELIIYTKNRVKQASKEKNNRKYEEKENKILVNLNRKL